MENASIKQLAVFVTHLNTTLNFEAARYTIHDTGDLSIFDQDAREVAVFANGGWKMLLTPEAKFTLSSKEPREPVVADPEIQKVAIQIRAKIVDLLSEASLSKSKLIAALEEQNEFGQPFDKLVASAVLKRMLEAGEVTYVERQTTLGYTAHIYSLAQTHVE